MKVEVRIVDRKFSYGHWRMLVEPVNGQGQKWVNEDRLEAKQ